MKIYNGNGGYESDAQIKSGVLWVALSTTSSTVQRQYTYLQTKTYAVAGCEANCYNNGVCINGQCSCYTGFVGPNCETAGMINQQIPHCPNNCTGLTVCPPKGYSRDFLTLIKNGIEALFWQEAKCSGVVGSFRPKGLQQRSKRECRILTFIFEVDPLGYIQKGFEPFELLIIRVHFS